MIILFSAAVFLKIMWKVNYQKDPQWTQCVLYILRLVLKSQVIRLPGRPINLLMGTQLMDQKLQCISTKQSYSPILKIVYYCKYYQTWSSLGNVHLWGISKFSFDTCKVVYRSIFLQYFTLESGIDVAPWINVALSPKNSNIRILVYFYIKVLWSFFIFHFFFFQFFKK